MRNYNKALEFSEMALKIESSDFLVINNHACILSMMDGKELEAVKFLKKIINASIDKIAYGYYGEGMKWAKSLVNDNRVRLGLVYSSMNNKKMARKYLEEHLSNRQRGLFSNFEKKYVLSKITSLG
jgi:tetratricopeptide (TPR) repeat protein